MADDAFAFSAAEERILASLIHEMIPPSDDGRLPGAGVLGLTAHIARTVQQTPMLRPVVEYGLSAIAELAEKRTGASFTDVVTEFAATDQFFLPAFLFLVYSGYYQNARVVEALGLEPRAPHPEGYTMAPDDWTLLDPVRRRAKSYRK